MRGWTEAERDVVGRSQILSRVEREDRVEEEETSSRY